MSSEFFVTEPNKKPLFFTFDTSRSHFNITLHKQKYYIFVVLTLFSAFQTK